MLIFISVVLAVWTGLNAYVFHRLGGVPWVRAHVPAWVRWGTAAALLVSMPGSRWLWYAAPALSGWLEILWTEWLGVLFLLFVVFLAVDVLTAGGLLFRKRTALLRTTALVVALGLSGFAVVQGLRPPVVRQYEVELPGLPRARDGVRIAFVSDLHLGIQSGAGWLSRLSAQLGALKPDLIAIGGDLVDHNVDRVRPLAGELRALCAQAPLGAWAVLGNHEYYSGAEESAALLSSAGIRVLRDESVEVLPGLRLAGVDDIHVMPRVHHASEYISQALGAARKGREGVVFLSHTPQSMDDAAAAGAGLMLSGHTHNGQIWPFNLLVKTRFPEITGRYEHPPMTLIVSRGTGTWGPRMRLWRRGEILLITLRAAGGS